MVHQAQHDLLISYFSTLSLHQWSPCSWYFSHSVQLPKANKATATGLHGHALARSTEHPGSMCFWELLALVFNGFLVLCPASLLPVNLGLLSSISPNASSLNPPLRKEAQINCSTSFQLKLVWWRQGYFRSWVLLLNEKVFSLFQNLPEINEHVGGLSRVEEKGRKLPSLHP